jgi:hypothetical protein
MGVTITKFGRLEVNLSFIWEAGWEKPFGNNSTLQQLHTEALL